MQPLDWALTIVMADECHVPPWQFEAECSERWLAQLMAYRAARARVRDGD